MKHAIVARNIVDDPILDADAPEAELVARARQKNPRAVRLIIKRYNQRLFRVARSILRDDGEAEDALQDAYLSAFTHLDTFRGESQFGTWLARIVMNEAFGRLRRRHPTLELDVVMEDPKLAARIIPFPNAAPQIDPETQAAQREIRTLVERGIDTLPEIFRTVFVARVVEGMSVEETAEVLGILPETVKTRLHRARHLLRREMAQHIGTALGTAFPFAGARCERVTQQVLSRLGLEDSREPN